MTLTQSAQSTDHGHAHAGANGLKIKFEYAMFAPKVSDSIIQNPLQKIAVLEHAIAEGWELVSCNGSDGHFYLLLRREIKG